MSASQHLQGMLPHIEMVGRHIIGTEECGAVRVTTAAV